MLRIVEFAAGIFVALEIAKRLVPGLPGNPLAKWLSVALVSVLAARWTDGPAALPVVADAGAASALSVFMFQIYAWLEVWKDTLRQDLMDRGVASQRRPR